MSSSYYTPFELASMFAVSEKTIRRMAEARRLPGVRIGGQWRFSKAVIDAMEKKAQATGEFC